MQIPLRSILKKTTIMKYLNQLLTVLLVGIITSSCKKDKVEATPLASLNVTNAIVGGTTAKFGSRAATIANNNYTQFGLVAGANDLYIYPSTDSLNPYFSEAKFATNEGEIYSLFLTGTTGAVEAVKIKETIPYRTDSTAGIRFINLAPNKPSLDITLSTTSTVNEVNGLVYKNHTEFKTYPGLYNSTYTFQIRDAATVSPAAPLATFSLTATQVPRFANITIVIRQNGTGVAAFRVNNDR